MNYIQSNKTNPEIKHIKFKTSKQFSGFKGMVRTGHKAKIYLKHEDKHKRKLETFTVEGGNNLRYKEL